MMIILALLAVILCFQNGEVFGLTGGEPAKEGEFPFMVSIKDMNNCHFCGGTIIGETWVLSNAACYSKSWQGSIGFGSTELSNNATTWVCGSYNSSTQIKIDTVHYNPDGWDQNHWTHDLLLIKLKEPIPFGKNVQPVQLPEEGEPWPFNQTGIMLGWGYGTSNHPYSETNLQKAEVSTYSDEYCNDSSLWNGHAIYYPNVMKCGGEVNKTYFCFSDYGGPLFMNGKQYGIISYAYIKPGGGCGEYLEIFSPTMTFRSWIKEMTGKLYFLNYEVLKLA